MRPSRRPARSACSSRTWRESASPEGGRGLIAPRLILASASPQRRAILEQIGVPFTVRIPAVPELAEGPPAEVVLENAYRKAAAVAGIVSAGRQGGEAGASRAGGEAGAGAVGGEAGAGGVDEVGGLPILGVDTVVSLGARIFGKPRDEAHAAEMLAALAGRRHVVFSGLCLIEPGPAGGRTRTAAAQTVVEFRALDRSALDAYVATGEWQGRAGAYAIQGVGATLVNRIEGDYLGVVGLPVSTLLDLAPWVMSG